MAELTPEEVVALKAKITKAEKAYENLMLGTAVRVFTDQNGERVEYTTANRGALAQYIADLKSQLPSPPATRYTRPVRFNFL